MYKRMSKDRSYNIFSILGARESVETRLCRMMQVDGQNRKLSRVEALCYIPKAMKSPSNDMGAPC